MVAETCQVWGPEPTPTGHATGSPNFDVLILPLSAAE
jgi:hypothetical protein